MAGRRAFISFDFDHDEDLRNLLVGQAKNPDTPFEIADRSVKEAMPGLEPRSDRCDRADRDG